MARDSAKAIVIDASIARASGDASQHPTSRNCREFLIAFLASPHNIAMTDPIRDEWNDHQSNYARGWRRSMMSQKRIKPVATGSDHSRRDDIRKIDIPSKQADIMEKDCHLVEAALASDERIASLDHEVRALFRSHHSEIPGIGKICWVNPNQPSEGAIPWLQAGAPADPHRMLGHPPEPSKER